MSETPEIARLDPVGMVTLRGDLASDPFSAAVREATGHDLPDPRRIHGSAAGGVAWMSPDELLILCAPGTAGETAARLSAALGPEHHLVVDVSDARAVFAIAGPGAREVLAKGAPVDLSRAAFGPGDLRRTRLGQIAVGFWMTGEDRFELVCFRSVADFAETWLRTAAAPGSFPGFL
jgi:sarcosine oxidase, subunit gamma